MSDVPSDAATEAAARALCAYRSVEWGDLSPDDREGVLCEGEAALVAGMAVEYAALADDTAKIAESLTPSSEYWRAYIDGVRLIEARVRAAAGGTP